MLVVALVLAGLAAVDRVRGGASSPAALAERVVDAVDDDDLGALARLVEPGERAALLRVAGSWSRRFAELHLPDAVGGTGADPRAAVDGLDGVDVTVSGATPRVESRSGDVAVVGLGNATVRVRSDPGRAHGLLRAWLVERQVRRPQDLSYPVSDLPVLGARTRLVTVQRSGRWYLSVLATLLGPGIAPGGIAEVRTRAPSPSPTPQAAVEATLRALLDARSRPDVATLAGTLDASGSDYAQLWADQLALLGRDHPPAPVTALSTTPGPTEGTRAVVRLDALRVGDGSGFALDGSCLTTEGERTCLRPSAYRYAAGFGSLRSFELLGHDGAFSLTAVRERGGWVTSLPESLADALVGYAAGLTREQVLMVLGEARLDTPGGVLQTDSPQDVAFTSAGYALRTVHIASPGLFRVTFSPAGLNRTTLYDPDGEPSTQPFYPDDSTYRLTPGDHTLLVWADDDFARTLEHPTATPYVQPVEVHAVR